MDFPPHPASEISLSSASPATAKRIVHVPRRFVAEEWGGIETALVEISSWQQRAGWQPEIFTSLALAKEKRAVISGIPVRRFSYCYPFFGLSPAAKLVLDKKGGNLLSFPLLGALVAAKNVRLYHVHTLNRMAGEVRTAARLRGKPFVVSLHGGFFDLPTFQFHSLMQPTRHKWEWGKLFGALLGSRRVLNDADQVICVGQSELDQARQRIGHDRIAYLPNGVDAARFTRGDGLAFRRKHGIPARAFVVANISRIDAQKNQLLLLEAFVRLRSVCPESFLILMGPPTEAEYAEKLRHFVRENELMEGVKILPGLRYDDTELLGAFHACDVFALPSLHEPFGIVALEAWSCGKPVVASAVGGLRAVVEHRVNGLSFEPQTPGAAEEMASLLHELAQHPEWRFQLGAAGLKEVQINYDWRVVGRRLELLYQKAEENCRRRQRDNQAATM